MANLASNCGLIRSRVGVAGVGGGRTPGGGVLPGNKDQHRYCEVQNGGFRGYPMSTMDGPGPVPPAALDDMDGVGRREPVTATGHWLGVGCAWEGPSRGRRGPWRPGWRREVAGKEDGLGCYRPCRG